MNYYSWIYKAAVTLSQSNAQCRTSNHQKQVLFWTKVTLPFVMLRGTSWVFGKGRHLGKGEHRGVQTLLTAWASVWGYFSYPVPQRPFQFPYLLFLSSCFFAFFSNLGNQYKAIFIVPCLWTEGPMLLAKLMLHFAKKKHCCSCSLPRSKAVSQRGTCNTCFCLSLSVWLMSFLVAIITATESYLPFKWDYFTLKYILVYKKMFQHIKLQRE